MGRLTLQHRIEYAGFRVALAGLNLLGDDAAAEVGARLGALGYPLRVKRDVALGNIRQAFPDWTDAQVEAMARQAFAHLGRETVMMLRLSRIPAEEVVARTTVRGMEAVDADYRAGNGVVLVAGHLGNWEIGAAAIAARGYGIDAIAKTAANPLFYRHVVEARRRLDVGMIDFRGAWKGALRALRAGRMVAFAADQHAGRAGVWVPFFGRYASTFRGPALMSLRTGAPMHLTLPLRNPDGTYTIEFEPVTARLSGDLDTDVVRLTTAYVRKLEAAVRRHPGQYLWHHRRWRRPPSEDVIRSTQQALEGDVA